MTPARQALMQAWCGQGGWLAQCVLLALLPLSWWLGALINTRRWLYQRGIFKQHRLPVPVIVVGNVMVGGVGKTPITIALVQHLVAQGWSVGVLSRGYGRQVSPAFPAIQSVLSSSSASEVGDEPLLIARKCHVPVFVGADRVAAGRALLAAHPEVQVLVCDDGLQHWALSRDLELCVFDERGTGNGRLLPAGPLREAWPRQTLAGAQAAAPCWVIKTAGEASAHEFAVQRRLADFALQADGTQRALNSWQNVPVQALAGIAKPDAFFNMLRAHGLTLRQTFALPDHADLTQWSTDAFAADSQGDWLCTEKDAVKLWPTQPQVWAVPLVTTLPKELCNAVDDFLAPTSPPKLSSPHGQQTA